MKAVDKLIQQVLDKKASKEMEAVKVQVSHTFIWVAFLANACIIYMCVIYIYNLS